MKTMEELEDAIHSTNVKIRLCSALPLDNPGRCSLDQLQQELAQLRQECFLLYAEHKAKESLADPTSTHSSVRLPVLEEGLGSVAQATTGLNEQLMLKIKELNDCIAILHTSRGVVPGKWQVACRLLFLVLILSSTLGGHAFATGSLDKITLLGQIPCLVLIILMIVLLVVNDPRKRQCLYEMVVGSQSPS
ncbi:hypothetical protein V8C86DRAFT_2707164 [Haematococcus lacustris]